MSEDDGFDDPEDDDEELPLAGLRERVDAERENDGEADRESPFETVAEDQPADAAGSDELFEEVDVSDLDGEAVWDAVVEGDAETEELLEGESRMEADVESSVESTGVPDEHVIDKREYCQRCEFFAAPPDAVCTNEGTVIVELVDNGHFRVRGCPKVAADDEAFSGFTTGEE
ncbi:hypothetical protein ACFQEQ_12845 [Halolamina salina]|uniref:hypothetical protein n=1 Tax=Halolamina salina TaxID=1220023 RepID=UPI0036182668